jgi:hypothetical protein
MDEIEVRSFAAACLGFAAGFEPRRIVVLGDSSIAFYVDDAARIVVERHQSVKSLLRAHEARARRAVGR